jgi:hypothetical protein
MRCMGFMILWEWVWLEVQMGKAMGMGAIMGLRTV